MKTDNLKKATRGVTLIFWTILIYRCLLFAHSIYTKSGHHIQDEINKIGAEPINSKLFGLGIPLLYTLLIIGGLTLFVQAMKDRMGKNGTIYIMISYVIMIIAFVSTGVVSTGSHLSSYLIAMFGFFILTKTNSLTQEGIAGVNILFASVSIGLFIQLAMYFVFLPVTYKFFAARGWTFIGYLHNILNFLSLIVIVLELVGWFRVRASLRERQGIRLKVQT